MEFASRLVSYVYMCKILYNISAFCECDIYYSCALGSKLYYHRSKFSCRSLKNDTKEQKKKSSAELKQTTRVKGRTIFSQKKLYI